MPKIMTLFHGCFCFFSCWCLSCNGGNISGTDFHQTAGCCWICWKTCPARNAILATHTNTHTHRSISRPVGFSTKHGEDVFVTQFSNSSNFRPHPNGGGGRSRCFELGGRAESRRTEGGRMCVCRERSVLCAPHATPQRARTSSMGMMLADWRRSYRATQAHYAPAPERPRAESERAQK